MSVFVLVHGTWGGGWQWGPVAEHLRQAGHTIYAPTLTGCGDRHRRTPDPTTITLAAHIEDVTDLLFFNDLSHVVLVGWSYGSYVAAGVADAAPERVAALVNLDGGLPTEGRTHLDDFDDDARAAFREKIAAGAASSWIPAPTADDLDDVLFDTHLRTWVGDRVRPHPYASWTSPFPDRGGARHRIPSTYLRCITADGIAQTGDGSGGGEDPDIAKLRGTPNWAVADLPLNHLGLFYAPALVADALIAGSHRKLTVHSK